ncbi:MAG: NAD-dependent epimerase/dehydratase family protein [Chloroflexota bacterium]
MKILVTGGAGFIGSHAADAFVAVGHEVAVVDDLSAGRRENVNPAAAFYEVDIRSEGLELVFAEERPAVVCHHAAQVDVRRSVADPAHDAAVNVLGSLNVLEQCGAYGVEKVIYSSSGGAIYGEPVYLPCDEDHPIQPLCPYGVSKYAVEQYLDVYRRLHGLDYTVLRYGNVYGPRQDPYGEAGVVAIFAGQMVRGETPTINGSGEQERDFVYVGDCARANVLALEGGSGRAYNLGSGEGTSVNRLFEVLKEVTGYQGGAAHGPEKAGETFRIFLEAARAEEELGWRPKVGLREGLARTVEDLKREGGSVRSATVEGSQNGSVGSRRDTAGA